MFGSTCWDCVLACACACIITVENTKYTSDNWRLIIGGLLIMVLLGVDCCCGMFLVTNRRNHHHQATARASTVGRYNIFTMTGDPGGCSGEMVMIYLSDVIVTDSG